MKKFIAAAALALTVISPTALAGEQTEVEFTIQYDYTLLQEEAGVEALMDDIKAAAKKACTRERTSIFPRSIDKTCVDMAMTQAATLIAAQQAEYDRAVPTHLAALVQDSVTE